MFEMRTWFLQSSFNSSTPVFSVWQRYSPARLRGPIRAMLLIGLVAVCSISRTEAQDAPDGKGAKSEQTDAVKEASKKRLEIMQDAINSFVVTRKLPKDFKPDAGVKPVMGPKLRYDDQVRSLLDAGVWRIGDEGRATAYVTIELYSTGRRGLALLTYEFVSLSESPFQMASTKGPMWSPSSTELKFEPLTGTPAPSDSEKLRLTQMREIARRFTARQNYRGEKLELRLLAQPIDRYKDESHNIVDGATFVFANGTNPELGMLIETDGKTWKYGLFRLSSAAIPLELDGKEVTGIPPNAAHGETRAYTATQHGVKVPE